MEIFLADGHVEAIFNNPLTNVPTQTATVTADVTTLAGASTGVTQISLSYVALTPGTYEGDFDQTEIDALSLGDFLIEFNVNETNSQEYVMKVQVKLERTLRDV